MMLMTFNEFADVPSKMHIFYKTAFDALLRKHDALKPKFRRVFKTGLETYDFSRLFETFCFLSYADRIVGFDKKSAIKYAAEAIRYEGISVKSEDFVDDLTDSVCVMLVDGDRYPFVHRSFQEYFVASFLATRSLDDLYDIVLQVAGASSDRSVFNFLRDMNRELLIRKYVVPAAKMMIDEIRGRRTLGDSDVDIFSRFFSGFHVYVDGTLNVYWGSSESLARIFYSVLSVVSVTRFPGAAVGEVYARNLSTQHGEEYDADEDRSYIAVDESDALDFQDVVFRSAIVDEMSELLGQCILEAERVEESRKESLRGRIRFGKPET